MGIGRDSIMTTNEIRGKEIVRYHGVVVGESILGMNIFKDIFAGIRDIIGGRAGAYEAELSKAREIAFTELAANGDDLGANAIIGVDIDYEVIGMSNGNMLLVSVSGTAVTVR